jgi:signal transduction histidine kinase
MAYQSHSRYWGTFPLRPMVEEIAQSLAPHLVSHAIRVVVNIPAGETITAGRQLIGRAIEDLMRQAVAAMPQGGELVVTSAAGNGAVELEIADTGPTLSDDARRGVLDGSPIPSRGTESGALAMVLRIAELHGGDVTAVNCPEGGVALTLRIPQPGRLEAAA